MQKNKREQKILDKIRISVIMDMREQHLGYCETERKYWNINQGQEENYKNTVKNKHKKSSAYNGDPL